MRILVVAADRMEFPGILAHAAETRRAALEVRWARSAWLSGHEMLLAANGAGASRAAAAVDRALETFAADAVVSTGFCGALRPELGVADLVVADWVAAGERGFRAWPVSGAAVWHTGMVASVDHVVQTAEEKVRLADSGASAVEMEAAGVAERAVAHGLPFSCVKAVTDLGDETLANDFNKALREDGYFDTIVLLRGTLGQPLVRVRELFRLRKRCVRAARMLGDFFADLRF
jgi:adenosylhomocysteine nucleosidase